MLEAEQGLCSTNAHRQTPKRSRKAAARNAALEKKIDGLVQLLAAKESRQEDHSSTLASPPLEQEVPHDSAERQNGKHQHASQAPCPSTIKKATPTSPQPMGVTVVCHATADNPFDFTPNKKLSYTGSLQITDEDGQLFLDEYRNNLGLAFPFVQIAPHISVNDLRRTKPLLLQAISTVCGYMDFPRQKAMAQETLRQLVTRAYLEGEKSLDLLQGCLVLTAWYHFFTLSNPQLTNLVHLAAALVVDLGLNQETVHKVEKSVVTFATRTLHGRPSAPTSRDDDGRRALLGTFCLSSAISTTATRINALRFNLAMEEACSSLETKPVPTPLDVLAAKLARLQKINESIEVEAPTECEQDRAFGALAVYIKSMKHDLDRFWDSLSGEMQLIPSLRFARKVSEVRLFDLVLRNEPPEHDKTAWLAKRYEFLWKCAEAAKELCHEICCVPAAHWFRITSPEFTQFSYGCVILTRLASLERSQEMLENDLTLGVSMSTVFSDCAEVMERIPAEAKFNDKPVGPDTIWLRWASRVRIWQACCDRHESRTHHHRSDQISQPSAMEIPTARDCELPEQFVMDASSQPGMSAFDTSFPFFDDNFWLQMMQPRGPHQSDTYRFFAS